MGWPVLSGASVGKPRFLSYSGTPQSSRVRPKPLRLISGRLHRASLRPFPSSHCNHPVNAGLLRCTTSTPRPCLLSRSACSCLLLSTCKAGWVVSLDSSPSGIAVDTWDAIRTLSASREIAARLKADDEDDIAFPTLSFRHSGPLMGHDRVWASTTSSLSASCRVPLPSS